MDDRGGYWRNGAVDWKIYEQDGYAYLLFMDGKEIVEKLRMSMEEAEKLGRAVWSLVKKHKEGK